MKKTNAIVALAILTMLAVLTGCTPATTESTPEIESQTISAPESVPEIEETENVYAVKDVSSRAIITYFDDLTPSEGTVIDNGVLSLADGTDSAEYVFDAVEVGSFTKLCAVFNGTTDGGSVETLVRFEKTGSVWSDWYSYGIFSSVSGASHSVSASDSDAKMDIDTLIPIAKATGKAQIKLIIKRSEDGASPKLRCVVVTSNKAKVKSHSGNRPDQVELTIPAKSQMDIAKIGNSICSPTSTSMVLEYLGIETSQEVFAYEARDYGANIFGNWMFNTVAASAHGVSAYLDFFSENAIKYALSSGVPVVCSIHTSTSDALTGAPMAYTSGHLVCVAGYVTKDNVDYFIVYDPAVYTAAEVRHLYRCDQFMNAFTGLAYIIQDYEESPVEH